MSIKRGMPYDCKGSDGSRNSSAFRRLPPVMQATIRNIQCTIQEEVFSKNGNKYEFTSGFRSQFVNNRWGGSLESLHRLGCAADCVPLDGFFSNPHPPVVDTTRFRVLRSPADVSKIQKCWHVDLVV